MPKPALFDYIVLAAVLIGPILEWRWYWPRVVRAVRAGVVGTRAKLYRNTIAGLWIATLYILALWVVQGRSWSALWLGSAIPWRLSIGISAAAIVIALLVLQARKVRKALARPRAVTRLREQLEFADPLAPKTNGERRGFWLLSLTAGICEEILFRGFLMWLIAAWTNFVVAVIVSSVLFGCAHIYLGAAQVFKAATVGLVLALIVLGSGSLWPAIVIHAALDLSAGEINFRVWQAQIPAAEAAPVPLTS